MADRSVRGSGRAFSSTRHRHRGDTVTDDPMQRVKALTSAATMSFLEWAGEPRSATGVREAAAMPCACNACGDDRPRPPGPPRGRESTPPWGQTYRDRIRRGSLISKAIGHGEGASPRPCRVRGQARTQ